MRSSLLNSYSSFGKYLPNDAPVAHQNATIASISLKQNFIHERPFTNCKFDIQANRIYLLDTAGTLIHVNLTDNSFSTLKSQKVKNFTIDGNNSLSLLYVTPKSELYRVSFDNKKPLKVTNLNMSKIIAFERNYLRQMLMAMDYKLLFLCDLTKNAPSRIRSLKAANNQVFTNGCFASNNRYIILAIKNIEIRILEIMDLKTVHSIRLPFTVDNLKIQVSYDSRKIAIYGDCHIIFFININDENCEDKFTYELIQVLFLKTIPQLKYTYQNDLVFLGNDQILYAVGSENFEKAVPIFNKEYHIRMMGFDISLDCCKIAIVSNRTVFQLKIPKGLKKYIERTEGFKEMDHRKNGFSSAIQTKLDEIPEKESEQKNKKILKIPKNTYQYQDEDDSEEAENSTINITQIMTDTPQLPLTFPESQHSHLHSQLISLNIPPIKKRQLNYILTHLCSQYRDVAQGQTDNIIQMLLKMTETMRISAQNTFSILDILYKCISNQMEKLDHYGFILCPKLMAIVEKRLHKSFHSFFKENLVTLCSKYLSEKQWIRLLNWMISGKIQNNSFTIPLIVISILNLVQERIWEISEEQGFQEWGFLLDSDQQIEEILTLQSIREQMQKIQADQKYKSLLFAKTTETENNKHHLLETIKHQQMQPNLRQNFELEQLITKQEEIKKALSKMHQQKCF